ncbi:hypothetical protein GMRT_11397 [Giardia muris]|uniref:Uncharacterized protein n=1 Tax=Giardia muris TaxID=5742 RepID=A0A4Z1T760_GIAMU|nr:hypothetical protein GMRT_11397 [Giardia muris]|eukprot:TNJ28957.1 hypothetical protein GMRT_11397 [Giardia muris]
MCGCDSIISLLCLGLPAIAYAVVFGFLPRNATDLQSALTACMGGPFSQFGKCMLGGNSTGGPSGSALTVGRTWFIIVLLALAGLLLAIAVLVVKCVLCCCAACCPCICCCFDYLFGIAIGLAIPTVVDAGLYLFCALKLGNAGSNSSTFLQALCTYGGYGALSLGSAWLLSLVLVLFLGNKSCGMRALILILGSIVAFTVITVLVATNAMRIRYPTAPEMITVTEKLYGMFLGALDVVAYLGAFFIAKPCFCCGK